jgi:hypothetical protein
MATENELLQQILKALKGEGTGRSTLSTTQAATAAGNLGFDDAQAEKFAQLYKEISGEAEKVLRIKEQEAALVKQIGAEATKTRMELARQLVEVKEVLSQKEADLSVSRDALATLQDQLKASEALGDEAAEQTADLAEKVSKAQEIYNTTVKQVEEERKKGEELTKQAETLDDIADGTETILGKLGLSSKGWKNSFFGKLEELGKGDPVKGLSSAFGEMGSTVAQAIKPSNLLGQAQMEIFDATIGMIGAQDRALSAFNRATGAAGRYDSVIAEVRSQTFELGVDIEGASDAVQSLLEDFTAFSGMSKEAQAELAALGATFNQVGLNTKDFAGFFETATKSLGMNTEEATQTLIEMQAATQAIGIPISQLSAQLSATLPTLAAFGKEAKQVFLDTAAAAKTLGLQAQELTSIMGKFDTFQGATEATSRLNAALGTNINMMEMVEAAQRGPVEQLKVLRQGLDQAGVSFQSMGFFQKKMLADILTGGNVDQLGKIMSGSLEDMEAAQRKMEQQEASMSKLKEAAAAAAPAVTKFVTLFQELAVATQPIIDLMRMAIGLVTRFVQLIGPEATQVILLTVAALKIFGSVGGVLTAIKVGFLGLAGGMKTFLAAALPVAVFFTLLHYILAVKENSPVLYLLLPIVAAGMYAIATASGALGPALQTLGAQIASFGAMVSKSATYVLALGAAVALAGLGFKMLFESISFEKLAAVVGLFAAAAAFAVVAIPAAIGIAALGAGFLVLAAALAFIKTEDLQALSTMFQAMNNAETGGLSKIGQTLKTAVSDAKLLDETFKTMTSSIEALSAAISTLSGKLGGFSTFASLAFSSVAASLASIAGIPNLNSVSAATTGAADMFKATLELDTTAVENAEALVDTTVELIEAAKEAGGDSDVSKLLSELTNLLKANSGKGKGDKKKNERPIILSFDKNGRDVFAKGIIDNLMPEIDKKLDFRA